jgi:hypothetical protein
VLDEVRKAPLIVVLEDRTGVDDEAQLHALFRPRVPADVIAKAVRQPSTRTAGSSGITAAPVCRAGACAPIEPASGSAIRQSRSARARERIMKVG